MSSTIYVYLIKSLGERQIVLGCNISGGGGGGDWFMPTAQTNNNRNKIKITRSRPADTRTSIFHVDGQFIIVYVRLLRVKMMQLLGVSESKAM